MKVRLIQATPPDGSLDREDICWTEDFETPAAEFVRSTLRVIFDQVIEANLPGQFPFEHTFSR